MRISDWSSDVCSSDLQCFQCFTPSPEPGGGDAATDQDAAHSVDGRGGRHKRLVMTIAFPGTSGTLARAVASLTSAACPSVWHRSDDPPDDPPDHRSAAQGVPAAAPRPRACHWEEGCVE